MRRMPLALAAATTLSMSKVRGAPMQKHGHGRTKGLETVSAEVDGGGASRPVLVVSRPVGAGGDLVEAPRERVYP